MGYDFVNDPTLDDVVSWSEGGDSFVIWKPHELQVNVLPRFFKHNNLCSFIRQLNTYDFRKVAGTTGDTNSDVLEFRNSNFRRDAPELLGAITRKKPGKKGTVQSQSHPTIRAVEQKINMGNDPLRDFSPDDLELIAQTCLGSSDANKEDLRRIMSDSTAMINAITSLSSKQERAEQMLQTVSHELANAQRMIATLQARRGSNSNFPPSGSLPFATPGSMIPHTPTNHTVNGERRASFEQQPPQRRNGWNEAEMQQFDPSQLDQAQSYNPRQPVPNQRQYMGVVERAPPQYSSPSPQMASTPTQNGITRRDDTSNNTEDVYKTGRSNIVVKSETTVEASPTPSPLVPIVIPTRNEVAALAKKGKSEEYEAERR